MFSVILSRDLFSPTQAARLLSLSTRCVLGYCADGRLDVVSLTARAVRITGASLVDFAASRGARKGFVGSWKA